MIASLPGGNHAEMTPGAMAAVAIGAGRCLPRRCRSSMFGRCGT